MNCPSCGANIQHVNAAGDTVLRNRGLVLKSSGIVAICPRCKSDVPLSQTLHKALQDRIVLFFRGASAPGA